MRNICSWVASCWSRWAVLILLLVNSNLLQAQNQLSNGWEIAAKTLKAPLAASEALRSSIAATPTPDLEQGRYAPTNREQWDAFIAAANSAQTFPLKALEQAAGVRIEADVIAGVNVHRVTPNELSDEHEDHLFIYIHGGAYVFGSGDASISEGIFIASTAGIPTLTIDYRMPPEHPVPAALDDVVAVYREIIRDMDHRSIAMGGTSAGAGLTLATQHQLKNLQIERPAALFAGTPWSDLTKTGDTLYTNEGIDRILITYDGYLGAAAKLYAGDEDLLNPLLSPVYGKFEGFPPVILVSGTRDMFLSDTVRTHRKLSDAGVEADLHVYEGMSHAEYGFVRGSSESQSVYAELSAFLSKHLP